MSALKVIPPFLIGIGKGRKMVATVNDQVIQVDFNNCMRYHVVQYRSTMGAIIRCRFLLENWVSLVKKTIVSLFFKLKQKQTIWLYVES